MATRNRSWFTRLLGNRKSKSANRKPVSAKPRFLHLEYSGTSGAFVRR